MANTTVIDALNVTVDPELDRIIMYAADVEKYWHSYEKAVAYAASQCTREQAMRLSIAYKTLTQTMEDIVSHTEPKI